MKQYVITEEQIEFLINNWTTDNYEIAKTDERNRPWFELVHCVDCSYNDYGNHCAIMNTFIGDPFFFCAAGVGNKKY